MNLNKVMLCGRLTNAPTLRKTKSDMSVATFSLATSRVWTDKEKNKQEETEFHNVVVWGRQAEVASKFLVKGQGALVIGRLATREYEDKAGAKRKATEIVCEEIQFGQKPSSPVQNASPLDSIPATKVEGEIRPEDLPF